MSSNYETITAEFGDDGVTRITLDRPEKKNAMNPQLHKEMIDVLAEAKQDALDPEGGTRALKLTGAGDSFCAGEDLDEMFLAYEDDPHGAEQAAEIAMEWGKELLEFPSPTVAAVNGWTFGGGVRVLCSCDLAVAAEDAKLGLSEVNWGIFPGGGSTHAPSRVLSKRDFLYLSLTGQDIDGIEAAEMGLVNEAVPAEDLDDHVEELVQHIADLNPRAVRYAKEVYLHEAENNMTYDAAVDYELAKVTELRQLQNAEDMRAVEAFKDSRFRPGVETYSQQDIEDLQQ